MNIRPLPVLRALASNVVRSIDPRTDLVLPDMTLATDCERSSHRFGMRGHLGANAKDMFWVVDPVTGTYRIFTLGNPASDSRRIHQFVTDKLGSSHVTLERIQRDSVRCRENDQRA